MICYEILTLIFYYSLPYVFEIISYSLHDMLKGEALGSTTKGILEPLQAVANKGYAGLGWNHIR